MKRDLRPIPVSEAMKVFQGGGGKKLVTMGVGQWDSLLSAMYDQGWILLELDRKERPVAAYQKRSMSESLVPPSESQRHEAAGPKAPMEPGTHGEKARS
jgi:hypothetical protein